LVLKNFCFFFGGGGRGFVTVSFDVNLQLSLTDALPTSSRLRQQVPTNHLLMNITFGSATVQNQIIVLITIGKL